MGARTISWQPKPNSAVEFTHALEKDVMPLLRKQQGFQDEIAFVVPGRTEAVRVSLWDQKEHTESRHLGTYPAVLSALASVVEGTP